MVDVTLYVIVAAVLVFFFFVFLMLRRTYTEFKEGMKQNDDRR